VSNLRPIAIAKLAVVRSGGGAPQDPAAFSNHGYPFIRAGSLLSLLNGRGENDLERIDPDVARAHRLQLFPQGTVLFAKSGMSATKGYIYRLKQPAYVVNHLAALVPHDARDSGFLARALQRFHPTSLVKDQGYPSIRLGDIEKMEVLAPLGVEGRSRIAAILDKADALRRKHKRTLDLLGGLTASIFLEMFGDPMGSIEYRVMPIGEVLEEIGSGWSPTCLDRVATDDEPGVLKLSAVTSSEFRPGENKALPSIIQPKTNTKVIAGDILLCRKNTRELIGSSVYVWETRPHLYMSDLIFRLTPDRSKVHPIFLQAQLSLPSQRRKISEMSGGAAGSMPNVSKSRLRDLQIIVPKLREQIEFAKLVQIGHRLRERQIRLSLETESLFSSLQHRAFSGQL
jgi:type I restriction enzyme, S subunit